MHRSTDRRQRRWRQTSHRHQDHRACKSRGTQSRYLVRTSIERHSQAAPASVARLSWASSSAGTNRSTARASACTTLGSNLSSSCSRRSHASIFCNVTPPPSAFPCGSSFPCAHAATGLAPAHITPHLRLPDLVPPNESDPLSPAFVRGLLPRNQ